VSALGSRVGQSYLLVNRVPVDAGGEPRLAPELADRIHELHLPLLGLLPLDPAVSQLDALGQPLVNLPLDAPIRRHLIARVASVLPVAAPV